MVAPNSFSKTLCSICYEDLKPIDEDLQAISICGHQWFGYCTNKKKQTCPVCKQGCIDKNVCRLYFQSIGDQNLSQSQTEIQKCGKIGVDECPPELSRIEVKRLEAKVSALNSALDLHQKDIKQITDELQNCKEQLSKEILLKNEALSQRECIQAMLQTKSSDLVKSNLECSKLQEKNLALVKEIAALKLVSDCNLEEEEIVKLATVGHENNSQDAIDVLKKSLVIRNKSYKELMAKCNSLGRGEARSLKKLEKANDKIVKLKTRVQELETAIEEKDNELLRSLKASKKRNCDDVPSVNKLTNSSSGFKNSLIEEKGQSPTSVIDLDEEGKDDPFPVKENTNHATVKFKGDSRTLQHKETRYYDCIISEEDEPQKLRTGNIHSKAVNRKDGFYERQKSFGPVDLDDHQDLMHQSKHQYPSSSCRNEVLIDHSTTYEASGLALQDIKQVQPSFKTVAETSSIPVAEPGNRCFTGGLLGPDGANRYLGKWCKRAQNKSPLGSSSDANTLIAVGADGRGGNIKDIKDSIVSAKRFKPAAKSSGLQSQGCRQIDHFFSKANN
ncbi:E3 ubiquitin-protein ligase RNF5 [Bienertia sinuspersici]